MQLPPHARAWCLHESTVVGAESDAEAVLLPASLHPSYTPSELLAHRHAEVRPETTSGLNEYTHTFNFLPTTRSTMQLRHRVRPETTHTPDTRVRPETTQLTPTSVSSPRGRKVAWSHSTRPIARPPPYRVRAERADGPPDGRPKQRDQKTRNGTWKSTRHSASTLGARCEKERR